MSEVLRVFEAHRMDQRLPQESLAQRAGLAPNLYGTWTRGAIISPTLPTVFAIAEVLGLRVVLARRPRKEAVP